MPRNGFSESTSVGEGHREGRRRRRRRPGGAGVEHEEPGDQTECHDEAGESTVPAVTSPPTRAAQVPHEHTEHGVARPDPYHWMRDHESPELLEYLAAERRWYESATGHLSPLVDALRSEMKSRVPATDLSVSWRHQSRYYYTVLPAGREYTQLLRDFDLPGEDRSGRAAARRQPAGRRLRLPRARTDAWSARTSDCSPTRWTGPATRSTSCGSATSTRARTWPTWCPRSYYSGAWSADSAYFFYTVHDEAYRPFQVWRHAIGTSYDEDALVLDEPDERFELEVRGTRSGGLVVIWSQSRDTREVWVLDAHAPLSSPALGRRSPHRRRVPRRARRPARRHRHPAGRDQRRRPGVPAGQVPGPPRRRPGPHHVGAGAARGPVRTPGARRRVRDPRGAQLPLRRPAPAAGAPGRRARLRRASWSHPALRRAAPSTRPTTRTSRRPP